MKYFVLSLLATSLCSAQEPVLEFYCQGPPAWTNLIKYPTTSDRIRFLGPLGRTYPNECEAELTNVFSVLVNWFEHSIELRVDSQSAQGACPRYYAPVSALGVEVGPLYPGDWTFWSSAYGFTNLFTVYPNPAREEIRLSRDAAMIHVKWPAVGYLKYELQASILLSNWQTATTNYTFDGVTMTVSVTMDTPCRFFRLQRSSLVNTVFFQGPGGCP